MEIQHPSPPVMMPVQQPSITQSLLPSDTVSRWLPNCIVKVLFFHPLSITRKGPVYLGTSGGFARVSSHMYTYSQFRRSLAMNAECRNFFASSWGGVYLATLSLASCSCCASGSDGGASCLKQRPGTRSEVPYKTSAGAWCVAQAEWCPQQGSRPRFCQ